MLDILLGHLQAPIPPSLSSSNDSIVFTRRLHHEGDPDQPLLFHKTDQDFNDHISWGLISTANTCHEMHVDPEGLATVIKCISGFKIIIVYYSKPPQFGSGPQLLTSGQLLGVLLDSDDPDHTLLWPEAIHNPPSWINIVCLMGNISCLLTTSNIMSRCMMSGTLHRVITPTPALNRGGHHLAGY